LPIYYSNGIPYLLGKKTIYYGSSKTNNLIFDGNKHTLPVSGSMSVKFNLGAIGDLLIWVQDVIEKRGCWDPWNSNFWDVITPKKQWSEIN